ncbi:MAG: hypothetical protein ACRD3Q_11135 [Terriglobales bacterium]
MAGRFDESLRMMREVLKLDPGYRSDVVAYIMILNGRYQALASLIAVVHNSDPLGVAEVYAYRREPDRAFECLSAGVNSSYAEGTREPGFSPEAVRLSPFVTRSGQIRAGLA